MGIKDRLTPKRAKEAAKKTEAVKKAAAEIRKSTSSPQRMPDATARNLNAIDRQHGGSGNRF